MGLAKIIEQHEFIIRRHFQIQFSLTPSETRLAYQLLSGGSLKACARDLGISYQTARSTLRSVFHKTGTHRQAELILLIALPPN